MSCLSVSPLTIVLVSSNTMTSKRLQSSLIFQKTKSWAKKWGFSMLLMFSWILITITIWTFLFEQRVLHRLFVRKFTLPYKKEVFVMEDQHLPFPMAASDYSVSFCLWSPFGSLYLSLPESVCVFSSRQLSYLSGWILDCVFCCCDWFTYDIINGPSLLDCDRSGCHIFLRQGQNQQTIAEGIVTGGLCIVSAILVLGLIERTKNAGVSVWWYG